MICYLYWLMNILNTSWLCNKTLKLFSGCIVILIICFASFLTVSFQPSMIKETQWPSQIFLLFSLPSQSSINPSSQRFSLSFTNVNRDLSMFCCWDRRLTSQGLHRATDHLFKISSCRASLTGPDQI